MGDLYAIGDIHGYCVLLDKLLDQIEPLLAPDDRVVFLGDYVDRGPQSREVVDRILALRESAPCPVICLRGNHEEWMLECREDPTSTRWLTAMEGLATVGSYDMGVAKALDGALHSRAPGWFARRRGGESMPLPYDAFFDAMPEAHRAFFDGLVDYVADEDVICVHAGIDPGTPLSEQPDAMFRWADTAQVLALWDGPQTLVVGHTPTYRIDPTSEGQPILAEHMVLVDTGAYSTGVLCAVRLPDRKVFRASCL